MKRILSLLLCVLMTAVTLAGCGEVDENDKGAIVPSYLATEITNFDPAYALHDEAGAKILGLIYAGLFRINEAGKLEKLIANSWKTKEIPEDNYYMLEIELKETFWSDGRQVSADDFVFAWKRLLEPEFQSEAASLLYDIKNARAVKSGDMTIDDLGLYAADTTVLQIEFEGKIDYDQFLENLSSIALVPLREDAVVKLQNWASNSATMTTNGPYNLKKYVEGQLMELERNVYYFRDVEKDELMKSVLPYRFTIDFTKTAEEQLAMLESGEIFFDGELPLASRADYASKAEVKDTMSMATVVFNAKKTPLDKAEVRKALSIALDRSAIVNLVTFAKAAEGFVPDGCFETTSGTSFRANGAVLSTTGDVSGAQSLLSSAGVSSGKLTLAIRDNPVDRAVAEYCVGVWGQLGFTVEIKTFETEYYLDLEYDQYRDTFEDAYRAGNFDMILVDYYSSTNAFSLLSTYSRPFSGGAIDLAGGNYDAVPHICGYTSDAYDELMEKAFAEKDRAARASILHEAETMLANDMPVAPLFTYQLAYAMSDELTNISATYDGYWILNKAKLKDYMQYQTTVADEAAPADTTVAG